MSPRSARLALIACLAAALAAPATAPAAAATPDAGQAKPARVGDVVPGSYIVTLSAEASIDRVAQRNFIPPQALTARFSSALLGFAAAMSPQAATRLAEDPRVVAVEPNRWLEVTGTQSLPPWGLDRIDQRALPLGDSYAYETTGAGVNAYILDTGVRASHIEFGSRVAAGFDATGWGSTDDCNGHGTHVAGTVAGATSGVAKGARIVPVRAMYCDGSGTAEDILEALDWIAQDHDAGEPAVANMSVASSKPITAVDTAVRAAIADGITVVVAAGNEAADACYVSPANVVEALTVGATDRYDAAAYFSNYGACLDIFAPGVDIRSTGHTGDTALVTMSGTSMAAPHVAGAAARYLQSDPAASPMQVGLVLTSEATPDAVRDAGTNSPTSLLYTAPPSSSSSWSAATTPGSTLTMAPTVTTLVYGQSTTLNGRLTSGGSGVAFETVRVERRRAGTTTWKLLTRKTSDRYGRVALTTSPSVSNDYRMRYVGTAYTNSRSAADRVGVRTRVSSALSAGTVNRGDVAKIAGAVRPAHDGRSVVLQRYRDGRWRQIASKALNTDSRYTFRLPTSSRGTFRFRVVKPGDSDHLRGFGAPRRLTVE